jgi:Tol biopolymer transport system component
MDRSGGNQRNVTESAEDSNWSPAWTPDGRIIFSSMRGGGPALELWVMEPDGRGVEQVATGWCEYPSAAPDGSAYVCSSPVGGAYDLVVVSAEGVRTPLTTTPASEFGASWSPDGRWIAFSRDLGDRWSLLQIRPDGTDEREVAREGVFPTWTPDGRLAWTGPGGINVAGTDPSRPTVVDLPAEFPSWGP